MTTSNGTVETEHVPDDKDRTHVIKRYLDRDGVQQRIEVLHPVGSAKDRCVLHRKATMSDAYHCVQTLGTEHHP